MAATQVSVEHPQPAPVKQASVSPPAREPARQQAVIASPRQLSRTPVQSSQPLLGDLGIGTPGGPPLHEVRLYGPPAAGRQCSDHQHDHVYLEHRAKLLICLTSVHPSGARPCSRMATVTMLLMRCCPGASGRSHSLRRPSGCPSARPGSKRLMLQLRPLAASRLYGGHRLGAGTPPAERPGGEDRGVGNISAAGEPSNAVRQAANPGTMGTTAMQHALPLAGLPVAMGGTPVSASAHGESADGHNSAVPADADRRASVIMMDAENTPEVHHRLS